MNQMSWINMSSTQRLWAFFFCCTCMFSVLQFMQGVFLWFYFIWFVYVTKTSSEFECRMKLNLMYVRLLSCFFLFWWKISPIRRLFTFVFQTFRIDQILYWTNWPFNEFVPHLSCVWYHWLHFISRLNFSFHFISPISIEQWSDGEMLEPVPIGLQYGWDQ